MNRFSPERAVRAFDEAQQTRWWLAHPIGVVRKYADDRGSALAGLVTFQLFLGLLPLLVVVLTVIGVIAQGSDRVRDTLLESVLGQVPVVGQAFEDDISSLTVSSPWVVVSIIGLLWTSTGIYTSLQLAMNQVWNVHGVNRQGFVNRQVRALLLFGLILVAAAGSAIPASASFTPLDAGLATRSIDVAIAVATSIVLLFVMFRITTSSEVPTWQLMPAAVVAGLFWEILQRVGSNIVRGQLEQSQTLYGSLGLVVAVLLWVNLLARSVVFANEWAVVSHRQLWPRRITQPPLTAADREVLVGLVRNEQRRPEQHIDVRFDDNADTADTPDDDANNDDRNTKLRDTAATSDIPTTS
jgi:YihY family inner membrane protein